MKNILFVLIFSILSSLTFAQDGAALVKEASKNLKLYLVDQKNFQNLNTAKEKIDAAFKTDGEFKNEYKTWIAKAQIYQSIAENPVLGVKNLNAVDEAYQAYSKSVDMTTKKTEKETAITGLTACATLFNNKAVVSFENKDYMAAFKSFENILAIKESLSKLGSLTILDDKEAYKETLYSTALCANLANEKGAAIKYYEKVYEMGEPKSDLYNEMFNLYNATDEAKAVKILEEGRGKYPADAGLLFSEINYFVKKGKLNEVESRLKEAIAKEPDNVSLYLTLGKVYDDLSVQTGLDAKTAGGFSAQAEQNYKTAIEKDANNFQALYNLGALYFNKAATKINEMNNLPFNEQAKFDAMDKEVKVLIDLALPYFTRAEKIDPKDQSTLVALKQIYAQKGDTTKANEYKARLENK
jgi:hypothetical protein